MLRLAKILMFGYLLVSTGCMVAGDEDAEERSLSKHTKENCGSVSEFVCLPEADKLRCEGYNEERDKNSRCDVARVECINAERYPDGGAARVPRAVVLAFCDRQRNDCVRCCKQELNFYWGHCPRVEED